MRSLRFGLPVAATLTLVGCAALVLRQDERPVGEASAVLDPAAHPAAGAGPVAPARYPRGAATAGPAQMAPLALANAASVTWHRTAEARYYPGVRRATDDGALWPAGLPRLCIALSSGGLRSSAVGIGVLQGLDEGGVLDRVDLASAVSGGAFTIAWLHAQAMRSGAAATEILAESGEALREVERRPELTSRFRTVGKILRHAAVTPGRLGMTTARALAGDSEPYASTLGDHYAAALERIFLAAPPITLEEWRGWLQIERPELPFPIIGASIGSLGSTSVCRTRPDGLPWLDMPETAGAYELPFEITPLRIGSDAIGHTDAYARPNAPLDRTDFDLARVLATSGAAIDIPTRPDCALADLVGGVGASFFDLVTTAPPGTVPAGRWPLRRQSLHLTDGAYTENLAVYPAIRRLCRQIVVVDSELDPYLIFDGRSGWFSRSST